MHLIKENQLVCFGIEYTQKAENTLNEELILNPRARYDSLEIKQLVQNPRNGDILIRAKYIVDDGLANYRVILNPFSQDFYRDSSLVIYLDESSQEETNMDEILGSETPCDFQPFVNRLSLNGGVAQQLRKELTQAWAFKTVAARLAIKGYKAELCNLAEKSKELQEQMAAFASAIDEELKIGVTPGGCITFQGTTENHIHIKLQGPEALDYCYCVLGITPANRGKLYVDGLAEGTNPQTHLYAREKLAELDSVAWDIILSNLESWQNLATKLQNL